MPDSSLIIPVLWSAATRTSTNDFDRRSSDGVPKLVVDMLNKAARSIQANHPPAEVWLLHRGVGTMWVLTQFSDAGRSQGGRRMRQYLSVIISDEDFNRVGRNPGRLMRAGVCAQVLEYARSGTSAAFDAVIPPERELAPISALKGGGTGTTNYSTTTSLQQPDGRPLNQGYFVGRNYDSQTARQLLAFVDRDFEASEGPPCFATWWPAEADGKQWFDIALTKVKIDLEAGDAQERAKDLYNEVRKTKAKTPGLNWARLDKNADTCLQKLEEFALKFYKSDPNPGRESELRQLKSEAIVYAKNAGEELELLGEEISHVSEEDPLAPQLYRLGDAYSRFADEDLASLYTSPKVVAPTNFNRDPTEGFGDPPNRPDPTDFQNTPKAPPGARRPFPPIAKIAGAAGLAVVLALALLVGKGIGNKINSPVATPVATATATVIPTPTDVPAVNTPLTDAEKSAIFDYISLNAFDEAYQVGRKNWRYLGGREHAKDQQDQRNWVLTRLIRRKFGRTLTADKIFQLGIIPREQKTSFWGKMTGAMDAGIRDGKPKPVKQRPINVKVRQIKVKIKPTVSKPKRPKVKPKPIKQPAKPNGQSQKSMKKQVVTKNKVPPVKKVTGGSTTDIGRG